MGDRGISGVGVEEVGSAVEEGSGQSGRGGWAEVGDGLQGDRSGGGSGGGYGGDSSCGGVGGVFDMGTKDDRGREVAQVVVGTEDDRGHEVAQMAIGSGRAGGPLRGGSISDTVGNSRGKKHPRYRPRHWMLAHNHPPRSGSEQQEGSRGGTPGPEKDCQSHCSSFLLADYVQGCG